MLAITRRNTIKEILQEQKSVTITELALKLDVTKETIRRDLRVMENEEELIRTHGGAYIIEGVQNDIDISTRQDLKTVEKELIANKCDSLIQSGDIIFLDSSTTAWFLARKISQRKLTVLTTSLEIANILSKSPTVSLYLIGGEFSRQSMSFTGANAVRNLSQYFTDKAFISPRSVSIEDGITDTNENSAAIHKTAISHSKETFIMLDHSKLDKVSFTAVEPLTSVNALIMDTDFSLRWQDYLKSNKIRSY